MTVKVSSEKLVTEVAEDALALEKGKVLEKDDAKVTKVLTAGMTHSKLELDKDLHAIEGTCAYKGDTARTTEVTKTTIETKSDSDGATLEASAENEDSAEPD